jgi:hypothetical protein
MIFEIIDVECYSGYKTDERPISFTYHNEKWEIKTILDRWYAGGVDPEAPIINYFKVQTIENSLFLIRYNQETDKWSARPCNL